jgi:hypothetical protein
MYEDPQDVFRDTDELFSHLYTRMTRDFAAEELKRHSVTTGSCSVVETHHRYPVHSTTSCGQALKRLWKFTGLVMR